MLRRIAFISVFVSCAPSAYRNPVQVACVDQAVQVSTELAKIAAEQNETSAQATAEYVNACEGQLQHDLDQTLIDLEIIADGGTSQ